MVSLHKSKCGSAQKVTDVWSIFKAAKLGKHWLVRKIITSVDEKRGVLLKDPKNGFTALHIAAKYGHSKVVECLLEGGAGVNEQCQKGCTPLHYGATSASIETVRVLLAHGANKLIRNHVGVLPQDLALSTGCNKIASLINRWTSVWDHLFYKKELEIETIEEHNLSLGKSKILSSQLGLLEQKERVYGKEHPGLIKTLVTIANQYKENKECGKAISSQQRAIKISEKYHKLNVKNADEHFINKSSAHSYLYNSLGKLYLENSQFKKSEQAFQTALRLLQIPKAGKMCNTIQYQLKDIMENIAHCNWLQGNLSEAENWFRLVIQEIPKITEDKDHPMLGRPLMFLGQVVSKQGKYEEAKSLFTKALALGDKHFGPLHLDIASVLDNLAYAFYDNGEFVQAEAVFRRALHIREKLLHPMEHESILRVSWNNISMAIIARKTYMKRCSSLSSSIAYKGETITSHGT